MYSKLGQWILEQHLLNPTFNFTAGTEVERDRTNLKGQLSTHPYPTGIGNQATNPWITNDFLEAMSEVVTPPAENSLDAIKYSHEITTVLRKALAPNEVLWPLSMPPTLPKDQTDLSLLAHAAPKKRNYILGLYRRFGMAKQTPCGVHLNMSVKESVMQKIAQAHHTSLKTVKNKLYSRIARGFIQFHWLLTYFFGTSPVAQPGYFHGYAIQHPVRSIRQSKYGYPSSFAGDYTNVDNYITRLKDGIAKGTLMSPAELYDVVRFKSGQNDLKQLLMHGIRYIELRMFDLDPTCEVGLKTSTLKFIKLLMLYFMMITPEQTTAFPIIQKQARTMNERVALEIPNHSSQYQALAQQVIDRLYQFTNQLNLGPEYLEVLSNLNDQVKYPEMTLNGRLMGQIKNHSLLTYGINQARMYQKHGLQNPFNYHGFQQELHLSAQALISHL